MSQRKQCTAARCDEEYKVKVPEDPEGPFRYVPQQCKRMCEEGENLCKVCKGWLATHTPQKMSKWNGYINGEIPPESHLLGSAWNLRRRAEASKKLSEKAVGVATEAPKAKRAAKKALEAIEEAKEATAFAKKVEEEAKEARSNAVEATLMAEAVTKNVASEVVRRSSSEGRSNAAGNSMLRIAIPKSTRRKTAKKSAAAAVAPSSSPKKRTVLGMAEMSFSRGSRATARRAKNSSSSAKKSAAASSSPKKRTVLGMAEMRFSRGRRATARRDKNSSSSAKESPPNLTIYRPASAVPSPVAAGFNSYRTPHASASPIPPSNAAAANRRVATPYSSPTAAITGMANFYSTNTERSSPKAPSPNRSNAAGGPIPNTSSENFSTL
jgi:hypothetical protein